MPASKKSRAQPKVALRRARRADYRFALDLYLESQKPLLAALGTWDERRVVARFGQAFKLKETRVIRWNGSDIGWIQVSNTHKHFHLHQLHIVADCHNNGIGSLLIRDLLERAETSGRAVVLNVIRGNRATSLYRRLGFRVVGEDREKLRMRWEQKPPEED